MPYVPGKQEPIPWERICNYLARECGIRPDQVDHMCISEIIVILDDNAPKQHSRQQMQEDHDNKHRMTPLQRLESRRR